MCVFGYLSVRDVCAAGLVCRYWRVVHDDDWLWHRLVMRDLSEIARICHAQLHHNDDDHANNININNNTIHNNENVNVNINNNNNNNSNDHITTTNTTNNNNITNKDLYRKLFTPFTPFITPFTPLTQSHDTTSHNHNNQQPHNPSEGRTTKAMSTTTHTPSLHHAPHIACHAMSDMVCRLP